MLGLQRAGSGVVVAVQPGSPPPVALALFNTGLAALAVGVTGITKLAVLPGATLVRLATVQVTSCPVALQPAGSGVPMVRPAGMVSVMVVTPVVAALPVLLTVKV